MWCRLEHRLIGRSLFGNLREKFLLRDDALLNQQLCQGVGLGEARHEKFFNCNGCFGMLCFWCITPIRRTRSPVNGRLRKLMARIVYAHGRAVKYPADLAM
jgi:hypothetical protein